jgi:iron complex outermembrane recepter protein
VFSIPNTPVAFPTLFQGRYPGGGISGDKTTWKLGLEHDLNPDLLAFASATTGYKSGGFNDGSPADVSPVPFYYRPETITSYEVGLKGTALDKTLYFSVTGFHYKYEDLQLGLVKTTGGQVTQNIPSAKVQGLELEGWLRLWRGGKVDYSLAYLDATYNDFFPLQGNASINFKGTPLDRAPDWTGRLGLSQDFPMANGGRISTTAAVKFSSSYVVTDGNTATQNEQKNYTRTDVTLGYYSPKEDWYVQAYGRNLENKRLLGNFELGAFTLTAPREFGLRAGFKL